MVEPVGNKTSRRTQITASCMAVWERTPAQDGVLVLDNGNLNNGSERSDGLCYRNLRIRGITVVPQFLNYIHLRFRLFILFLSALKMCRYQDKVHLCGHYNRSVDACDKAKKDTSLCDVPTEPKRGRKSKGSTGSTSYSAGIWYPHEGCDQKPNNKREGPGLTSIAEIFSLLSCRESSEWRFR